MPRLRHAGSATVEVTVEVTLKKPPVPVSRLNAVLYLFQLKALPKLLLPKELRHT